MAQIWMQILFKVAQFWMPFNTHHQLMTVIPCSYFANSRFICFLQNTKQTVYGLSVIVT